MKIVLIGIQGSGKSTQGNLLSKQLEVPYLSTGHIFRQIAKEETALGKRIKAIINAGLLVPNETVIEIVNNYLSRPEYKRGYILDGYPRTLEQAEKFKNGIDKVIYLKISQKEAIWRLFHRDNENREDETVPAIKKRIKLFFKNSQAVLDYYDKKKLLFSIDGTLSIELINQEILKSLGKQKVKNHILAWHKDKKKTIIAVVGLPGSGKTEAAQFFIKKQLPVISFGKIINDYVEKNNMPHIREVHKKVREDLREKYGQEALAILNKEKIIKAFKDNDTVIIDGMRSWQEYIYLKKEFANTRIFIVGLYADKAIRYQRLSNRKDRPKLYGEERDIDELVGINMGPTIAFADYIVKNNYSLEDFFDKLESVYRSIYFS